jgi:hypothetical protein
MLVVKQWQPGGMTNTSISALGELTTIYRRLGGVEK